MSERENKICGAEVHNLCKSVRKVPQNVGEGLVEIGKREGGCHDIWGPALPDSRGSRRGAQVAKSCALKWTKNTNKAEGTL